MFFEKLCLGAFLVMMILTGNKVSTGQEAGLIPFSGSSGGDHAGAFGCQEPVEPANYEELAGDLRSLGIVVPEELVRDLQQNEEDAEYHKNMRDIYETDPAYGYRLLLDSLGSGEYDDDFNWSPDSDQVYAVDTEMWGLDSMYTQVLNGIIAISGGEYAITDIVENTDQADYDHNRGVQTLSFKYNGVPYTFEGEVNDDWLDLHFPDFMNRVMEEQGNPKRLLMTGDGGQDLILLYNTPEWGEQLDAKTGLGIVLSIY